MMIFVKIINIIVIRRINKYLKRANLSSMLLILIKKIKPWWIILVLFSIICSTIYIGCERPTDANQKDDGIPPAVPGGVQISYASDGEILIEWIPNSEVDLKGYNVYRKTSNSDFEVLAFTTKSYWFDDSLSYDENYSYRISALDIWGGESQMSTEVSATPSNQFPPAKPRYLNINARNWEGKLSIFLSWEPNNESDVAGYKIYRSLNSSFTADSITLAGYTSDNQFNDTANISIYKDYYYKIRAADKGGLLSDESSTVNDQVYEMIDQIFPANDSLVNFFNYFIIKTVKVPANYKIIVQTNEYFGEFWSKDFFSSAVDATIQVEFNPPYLYPYTYYYWRVITFSNNSSEPNSISPLHKFKVKP